MLHAWVIALFVALALRDSVDAPLLEGWLTPSGVAGVTVGAYLLIGAVTHLIAFVGCRQLNQSGSWRAVVRAETAVSVARWAAAAVHVASILCLGWLDVVRQLVGDIVLVDEAIVVSLPVAVFAWGWWAMWPIERSMHDAATIRTLDQQGVVYPAPSRSRYVSLNLRHHVFVWLAPLAIILTWTESSTLLIQWLGSPDHPRGWVGRWLVDADHRSMAELGAELAGVAVVFLVLGPLAMRYVWDTVPLGPGELRDRLLAMCREHRVRVRDVYVWRTHGTMINGAVLGLTPMFRYVLLTDALLDSMSRDQVEAVMAHEVAHVRHRHIIWLAAIMIITISAAAWGIEVVLNQFGYTTADEPTSAGGGQWLTVSASGVALIAALSMFGFVSRRFEWQADAFAAEHMSKALRARQAESGDVMLGEAPRDTVSRDGIDAMAGALLSVAALNRVPPERRCWRHGSIACRVNRLTTLLGQRSQRAPVHAVATRIKLAALCIGLGLIGLGVWQWREGTKHEVREDARHRE